MKRVLVALVALPMLLGLFGCIHEINDGGLPPIHRRVLIVYGLSETADLYDVDRDTLLPDRFVTGNTPNFLLEADGRFYLVNSGFSAAPSLQVIEPQGPSVMEEAPLPNGSNPMQVAELNGDFYVTSFTHNLVYRLNEHLQVTDSVAVGRAPDGILAYNGKLYVVATFYDLAAYQSDTGKLYVLTPDLQVEDSLVLSLNPSKIAEDEGYLYVLGGDWSLGGGYLLKIDPTDLSVVNSYTITAGVPGALDVENHRAYIVGWSIPQVLVVDLNTMTLVDSLSLSLDEGNGVMGVDATDEAVYVTLFSNSAEVNDYLVVLTHQGHELERIVLGQGKGAQIVYYYELGGQ